MFKKFSLVALASMLCVGCASVPMASQDDGAKAKQFAAPSAGKAGLYVYRGSGVGGALKKDIWVDGKCVGESAPNVFFYQEIVGDVDHELATQSEFSPNVINVRTAAGKNYFVNQYIKMGVFVGGANLELADEEAGKRAVMALPMAVGGKCSAPKP